MTAAAGCNINGWEVPVDIAFCMRCDVSNACWPGGASTCGSEAGSVMAIDPRIARFAVGTEVELGESAGSIDDGFLGKGIGAVCKVGVNDVDTIGNDGRFD